MQRKEGGPEPKMRQAGCTIRPRIGNLPLTTVIKTIKKREEDPSRKVILEKVLGITARGNSGLACDPRSGLLAYPAGCAVVLLDPRNNRQNHIINTSRNAITALAFSPDGKFLATGESGRLPAVRLWDVAERQQVAELRKHKHCISCVAVSPNCKFIVSGGNEYHKVVNVWAWKKDTVVETFTTSSKVTAVSFSEDGSYFVTVGKSRVIFWYLEHRKLLKRRLGVMGHEALLGELKNSIFSDVACGRGSSHDSTFCLTSSGLLVKLNKSRRVDNWVDLQTSMAQAISQSEDLLFCGCADGIVRVFSPALRLVGTLPRPHALGADVSSHICTTNEDLIGLTYDSAHCWLSCLYKNHSLSVWDVRDVRRARMLNSALFHAAWVWDLQMFPDVGEENVTGLSSGAFLTCSSDGTVRLWCPEQTQTHNKHQDLLNRDLLNIIFVDGSTGAVLDPICPPKGNPDAGASSEPRTVIRAISVSPDGRHLASGDGGGILRIHDLSSMEEIMEVEAHDAEILCLEYSRSETGLNLLASASRDRRIHVLNASSGYSLVQTLDQHSSSITAVRFTANENKVSLISCSGDRSIYLHTAHKTNRGTEFRCSHHTVQKNRLNDMSVDATGKYAAFGGQDRCVRIFNISSGKQEKAFKGSVSDDGHLLKVQIDPSGQYVATSCSKKNISIFDFNSGKCVATAFGHSEIVTGMKFTADCKYLITVSGDSCIFMWRLAPELTFTMKKRLHPLQRSPNSPPFRSSALRRVHRSPVLASLSSSRLQLIQEDSEEVEDGSDHDDGSSSSSSDGREDAGATGSRDDGQNLEKGGAGVQVIPDAPKRLLRRWSPCHSLDLMMKPLLNLRQLRRKSPNRLDRDKPTASSLQDSMEQAEERSRRLSSPRGAAAALSPEEHKLPDGERDGPATLRTSRKSSGPEKVKDQMVPPAACLDPVPPSSLAVRQRRRSLSESSRREGDDKQRPLVAEDDHSRSPRTDLAVSMETCRRAGADLQSSLQRIVALLATLRNQHLSEEQQEMRDVLTGALLTGKAQLDLIAPLI